MDLGALGEYRLSLFGYRNDVRMRVDGQPTVNLRVCRPEIVGQFETTGICAQQAVQSGIAGSGGIDAVDGEIADGEWVFGRMGSCSDKKKQQR